jgi:pimeloyl-ACP methyl ester carboxylesterase
MLAAPPQEFDPSLPGLFAGDPPEEFLELLEAMDGDVRTESVERSARLMADIDQRDLLPQITSPTLLIWGRSDARSPHSVARQFEDAIPDAELVVLPDAGHMSNLEQPELFNAAVRRFLESR